MSLQKVHFSIFYNTVWLIMAFLMRSTCTTTINSKVQHAYGQIPSHLLLAT